MQNQIRLKLQYQPWRDEKNPENRRQHYAWTQLPIEFILISFIKEDSLRSHNAGYGKKVRNSDYVRSLN